MNWSKEWKTPEAPIAEVAYQTFEFRDGHKSRLIDVIIVGDLGLDFGDDGWNIYHIPTLSCFSKAVPGYNKIKINWGNETVESCWNYDRDQLLSWMKKVQENYPTTWTMLRLLTPENFKDKGESAKQIILDWCLSCPVE